LSGKFSNNVAHPLQITGSLVPAGAVAVNGHLTVVLPSSAGWAFVGPSLPSNPVSVNVSMVNSVAGDTKADGVTVALSDTGSLSFVWEGTPGSTTDVVFDVTGYFVNGTSGSRFVPIDPMRVADTRYGLPIAGPVLVAHPMVVPVAGQGHIASTAVAISGKPDGGRPDGGRLPDSGAGRAFHAGPDLDAQLPPQRHTGQRLRCQPGRRRQPGRRVLPHSGGQDTDRRGRHGLLHALTR